MYRSLTLCALWFASVQTTVQTSTHYGTLFYTLAQHKKCENRHSDFVMCGLFCNFARFMYICEDE